MACTSDCCMLNQPSSLGKNSPWSHHRILFLWGQFHLYYFAKNFHKIHKLSVFLQPLSSNITVTVASSDWVGMCSLLCNFSKDFVIFVLLQRQISILRALSIRSIHPSLSSFPSEEDILFTTNLWRTPVSRIHTRGSGVTTCKAGDKCGMRKGIWGHSLRLLSESSMNRELRKIEKRKRATNVFYPKSS